MNARELNEWIDNSPYTETEEVIRLLRQQQAERDLLFRAHSYEMVRADKLQIECDRLYRVIELTGALQNEN